MTSPNKLEEVLFVVVSCTRDRSREKALIKLVKSINCQHKRINFSENLLFFDNASSTQTPMSYLSAPAMVARCEGNVGYWSALYWAVHNAEIEFGRRFKYIHPIESDLILYRLGSLQLALDFLDFNQDIVTVRTQEFSVKHRQRYFKNGKSFFRVKRSAVANYNGVTEEEVQFNKASGFPQMYTCNWHSKVPALHRFETFRAVFDVLAQLGRFTEHDFMKEMYKHSPTTGLLDKGVYYAQLNYPRWYWFKGKQLTGSYMSEEQAEQTGYRFTRADEIVSTFPAIAIERCGVN